MIIKSPIMYDVSHYKTIDNYLFVSPRPEVLITKASEGAFIRDATLSWHMSGADQIGAVRGMYHFHRKAYSPTTQAKNFCDAIRYVATDKDILILDVEEGGETAAQLKSWFEYVMTQYPNNPYWIYSRKNILDPIATILGFFSTTAQEARIERSLPLNAIQMTLEEREFFKKIPVWTAGYPSNPDLYNSVPSFYVPDQTRWGKVVAWQYTDKGVVAGISGSVDLNWIDKNYLAELKDEYPPTNHDDITQPFQGVKRIVGVRHERPFSLVVADPKLVRYEVVHTTTNDLRDTPSNIARQTGAQFVWNGGEWNKYTFPYYPRDLSVSNGMTYVSRKEAVPSLIFKQDGTPSIGHANVNGQWNATSGLRYIVQNGAIPSYLNGTEPQYTDRRSRSIEGLDRNGHVMRLTVQGVYPSTGVTLREAAELMIEYGCLTAFDTSGGGDTAEVMNGQLMNVPEDIYNGENVERRIPEFLVMYAEENTDMADYYEYTATGNRAIRVSFGVGSPRIASNSDIFVGTIAKGGASAEDRYVLSLQDVSRLGGMVGDIWARVYDNNGKPVNGWTALTHLGVYQFTERLVAVTPPPAEPQPFDVTITIQSDGYSSQSTTITMMPL